MAWQYLCVAKQTFRIPLTKFWYSPECQLQTAHTHVHTYQHTYKCLYNGVYLSVETFTIQHSRTTSDMLPKSWFPCDGECVLDFFPCSYYNIAILGTGEWDQHHCGGAKCCHSSRQCSDFHKSNHYTESLSKYCHAPRVRLSAWLHPCTPEHMTSLCMHQPCIRY